MRTNLMKASLLLFVGLVIGAGGWLLWRGPRPPTDLGLLVSWFLACLAGEALWVRTPTERGTISMALSVDLAAIVTLNSPVSLVVIALSTLVAGVYPHRRPWYKALFNAAQSTLAAAAALAVIARLGSPPDQVQVLNNLTTWPALFAGGIVFFIVNSGLVACAIALQSGGRPWQVWYRNFGYGFELACTAAQISLAGFVVMAYQQMGLAAVLALLPILGVLWWSASREARARAAEAHEPRDDHGEMKLAS